MSSQTSPELSIAHAGAHAAARALSGLLRDIPVALGSLETVTADELARRHGARALVVGFTVVGGLHAGFAVVTTESTARWLAAALVRAGQSESALSTRESGALTELGNIVASAYMNGAAEHLAVACVPSVPTASVAAPLVALAPHSDSGVFLVARLELGAGHSLDLALSVKGQNANAQTAR